MIETDIYCGGGIMQLLVTWHPKAKLQRYLLLLRDVSLATSFCNILTFIVTLSWAKNTCHSHCIKTSYCMYINTDISFYLSAS